MFRYGDSSLAECLDVVCNETELAWSIAEEAFSLRDDPRVFDVKFHNVIDVALAQLEDLYANSRATDKIRQEFVRVRNHVAVPSQDHGRKEVHRFRELQDEVARRDNRILELERQLEEQISSVSWRLTRPLRAALGYLSPNQVRLLRRTITLCYWVLTPHRLPNRLKFLRSKSRDP
jgi:hypothetical protein